MNLCHPHFSGLVTPFSLIQQPNTDPRLERTYFTLDYSDYSAQDLPQSRPRSLNKYVKIEPINEGHIKNLKTVAFYDKSNRYVTATGRIRLL